MYVKLMQQIKWKEKRVKNRCGTGTSGAIQYGLPLKESIEEHNVI